MEHLRNQSLLLSAIHSEDPATAATLILDGADPNKEDYLHEATGCEGAELVSLLLQHGADPLKKAISGATALHDASLCGNRAAVEFLLESGVDVDARDNNGRTALHEASARGQVAVIRLLLGRGASVLFLAKDGTTPADAAIDNDHLLAFEILVKAGCGFDKERIALVKTRNLVVWNRNPELALLLGHHHATIRLIQARREPYAVFLHDIDTKLSNRKPADNRFCVRCNAFFRRPPGLCAFGCTEEQRIYNHSTSAQVTRSKAHGCLFCSMIRDALFMQPFRESSRRIPQRQSRRVLGLGLSHESERLERARPGLEGIRFDQWKRIPTPRRSLPSVVQPTSQSVGVNATQRDQNVYLTYRAHAVRHLRAPAEHLWSDFLDRIEVRYGRFKGSIRIASLSDDVAETLTRLETLDDPGTGLSKEIAMAGFWIRTCLTQHAGCNRYQTGISPLPPRVLDVGTSDAPRDPFLFTTKGQKGLYLTLSHRWADYDTCKTLQENLDERSRFIDMNSLPKVFADAVDFTRKLGIRFLWIDTLCIIQDDPEDWKWQASMMSDIFRNSLLTIAAAVDQSSVDGIFRPWTAQRRQPCAVDLRLPHRQRALFQRPGSLFAFADRRNMEGAERKPSVLDTRVWILQEQVLSPRILYFTEQEMFWDCCCLNASESYPTGIPDLVYERRSDTNVCGRAFKDFKEGVSASPRNSTAESNTAMYAIWRQLVQSYSARAITKPSDRLVAMSGMVKLVEKRLDDVCIFGLWKKRLNSERLWEELLWVDSHDHNAVTCEAEFLSYIDTPEFCALHLRGRITKMYPRSRTSISTIPGVEATARRKRSDRRGIQDFVDPTAEFRLDVDSFTAWAGIVFCLEIARAGVYQKCLCLTPATEAERPLPLRGMPVFQRVGMCNWNVEKHGELSNDDFSEILII